MTFQFTCPHGHALTASDDRVGKPGRCPDCGVNFVVPKAGSGSSSTGQIPAADEVIIFLCPNGHKLNGPRRLQGAAGQCPHCGSKFQIPTYPDDERFHVEPGALLDNGSFSDIAELQSYEGISSDGCEPAGSGIGVVSSWSDPQVTPFLPPKPPVHALADLLGEYWSEAGQPIEIHHCEGEVLRPDSFAKELSGKTHGVFGVKHDDETLSIIAIAWSDVRRIVIPGLEKSPPGFE